MSTAAIVLHKLLIGNEEAISNWSKLQLSYFPVEFQPIYRIISSFYSRFNKLPNLEELRVSSHRNVLDESAFSFFFDFVPPEEVAIDVAIAALIDEHVQNEALDKVEKFVHNITSYSREEIVEELYNQAYEVEKASQSSATIFTVQEIDIFDENPTQHFIPLGLSNEMDAHITGVCRTETILIGGQRGNGKSLVCSNLAVNEYLAGFVVPYFTIEMRAKQVHRRNLGIEAGVCAKAMRSGNLSAAERVQVAEVLIKKYEDAQDLIEPFKEKGADLVWLQKELKHKKLIMDNQIIIIDNPKLTLVEIDTSLARLKALYGDKMRFGVIDYLNQIRVPDIYSWESQIHISASLKELAAKYDMALGIPYQIDQSGEARFSKGILDSTDLAMTITACKDEENPSMTFTSTKCRDLEPFQVASIVDWRTLRITGERANIVNMEDVKKKHSKKEDSGSDFPKIEKVSEL